MGSIPNAKMNNEESGRHDSSVRMLSSYFGYLSLAGDERQGSSGETKIGGLPTDMIEIPSPFLPLITDTI